jgi:hypothetical protein
MIYSLGFYSYGDFLFRNTNSLERVFGIAGFTVPECDGHNRFTAQTKLTPDFREGWP